MKTIYLLSLLCALCSFSCDDSFAPENAFELGDTLSIKLHQVYHNEDHQVAIRFDSILSESRCPFDVECVWEGNAAIQITLGSNKAKQALVLNTNGGKDYPSEADALGYHVSLVSLWPAPCTTCKFAQDAYTAMVVVTKK